MTYKLLDTFRDSFAGQVYRHRASTVGDKIARQLYEDLYDLNHSARYKTRVDAQQVVANVTNTSRGVKARRGDGAFGVLVPGSPVTMQPGMSVGEGVTASIEIGVEVKILMKAMIKQIDRVASDLRGQADHFRAHGSKPICVGIVGINQAAHCTSYEGDREFPTDGKKNKHPAQEAAEAEARLIRDAAPSFDEFLILRFVATNEPPHTFQWVNAQGTTLDYAAVLARISQKY